MITFRPITIVSQPKGFTVIELLVVVAIIGVLASIVLVAINPRARIDEAHLSQSKEQLATLSTALEVMTLHSGGIYPADVDRDIPPGLESYLKTGDWPIAPFPGSVFDWDNYLDPDGSGEMVYQFSIRFCPYGDPDHCQFPSLSWANDFDYYSSVFRCLSGPCRSHKDKPVNHPGYCVNCDNPVRHP